MKQFGLPSLRCSSWTPLFMYYSLAPVYTAQSTSGTASSLSLSSSRCDLRCWSGDGSCWCCARTMANGLDWRSYPKTPHSCAIFIHGSPRILHTPVYTPFQPGTQSTGWTHFWGSFSRTRAMGWGYGQGLSDAVQGWGVIVGKELNTITIRPSSD